VDRESEAPKSIPLTPAPSAIGAEEARLLKAINKHLTHTPTAQLQPADRMGLPLTPNSPFGLDSEASQLFRVIPDCLPGNANPANLMRWRIELQGLAPQRAPIGIELVGDMVLGVDRGVNPKPDFDLAPFAGEEKGVSKTHALIRPTRNKLYLIDLQSTNGTRLNAVPVGPGVAMEIQNGDTISLGSLNFTVKVFGKV
jgi:hypothetical protein